MDERDVVTHMDALPDQFADRVPEPQLSSLRSLAEGGEYEELLDALLAGLHKRLTPITAAEREELSQLLRAMQRPTKALSALPVAA